MESAVDQLDRFISYRKQRGSPPAITPEEVYESERVFQVACGESWSLQIQKDPYGVSVVLEHPREGCSGCLKNGPQQMVLTTKSADQLADWLKSDAKVLEPGTLAYEIDKYLMHQAAPRRLKMITDCAIRNGYTSDNVRTTLARYPELFVRVGYGMYVHRDHQKGDNG